LWTSAGRWPERGGTAAPRTGDGRRRRAGTGPEAREIGGVQMLATVLAGVTGKDLPALIDEHKARLGSGAVL
jgi:hypothetical protein